MPFLALTLAALISITLPAAAVASPKAEKVYGPNGRRVAAIKDSAFGRRVYDRRGRRVATIKKR